jgi:hypothetical protein
VVRILVTGARQTHTVGESGQRNVLGLVPDLIDRSRIEPLAASVGASVRFVDDVASLRLLGSDRWHVVIVDLDAAGALTAISALPTSRSIGFGSHVNRELLDAARESGYDEVVSRSVLFRRLPALIEALS